MYSRSVKTLYIRVLKNPALVDATARFCQRVQIRYTHLLDRLSQMNTCQKVKSVTVIACTFGSGLNLHEATTEATCLENVLGTSQANSCQSSVAVIKSGSSLISPEGINIYF